MIVFEIYYMDKTVESLEAYNCTIHNGVAWFDLGNHKTAVRYNVASVIVSDY